MPYRREHRHERRGVRPARHPSDAAHPSAGAAALALPRLSHQLRSGVPPLLATTTTAGSSTAHAGGIGGGAPQLLPPLPEPRLQPRHEP